MERCQALRFEKKLTGPVNSKKKSRFSYTNRGQCYPLDIWVFIVSPTEMDKQHGRIGRAGEGGREYERYNWFPMVLVSRYSHGVT